MPELTNATVEVPEVCLEKKEEETLTHLSSINLQILNEMEIKIYQSIDFQNAGVPNYLILTVKAIDRDPGENGRVSYHLKVGNRNVQETEEFSIDQESGELRSKIILDREINNKFEVSNIKFSDDTIEIQQTFYFSSCSWQLIMEVLQRMKPYAC